ALPPSLLRRARVRTEVSRPSAEPMSRLRARLGADRPSAGGTRSLADTRPLTTSTRRRRCPLADPECLRRSPNAQPTAQSMG
ncbi:hypothetical protein, partial [Protofrankia symbiont of Coriaria ruscifolia]|uniref:hypothetical protein n=1 Tax=Protofrankia symbiont of Coriaria ruscifolia TaxID=1306542 RepID=UPI001A954367